MRFFSNPEKGHIDRFKIFLCQYKEGGLEDSLFKQSISDLVEEIINEDLERVGVDQTLSYLFTRSMERARSIVQFFKKVKRN